MTLKFILVALLVASANASGGYSSFSYGVSDPNTGDIKDQQENRVGGNVIGKYSLLESDGTKRVVEYSADDATGFKAIVHKEPVGGVGVAGITGHLTHPGAIGGAAIGGPIPHPASLAGVSHLGPAAHLAAGGHLAHGSIPSTLASQAAAAHAAHAAAAYAAKLAHENQFANAAHAPLVHAGAISGVTPLTHSSALAPAAPLAHGTPVAPFDGNTPLLGHGALGNRLIYPNAGHLTGHPGSSYADYGNPLNGPLDHSNHGAPAISSYSHTIVHNGPDAFPNGGDYGRYGGYNYGGFGSHGTGLAGPALAHGNPLTSAPGLAHADPWGTRPALAHGNPWASGATLGQLNPWASGAALAQPNPWVSGAAHPHGLLASSHVASGSRLGW